MNPIDPFLEYGGAAAVCSVLFFVVLFLLLYTIYRFGLNSELEVQHIKDKRMVDVSSVSLSFYIKSAKVVTGSSSTNTLHINLLGRTSYSQEVRCFFRTPIQEFIKYFNLNTAGCQASKEKHACEVLEAVSLHSIHKGVISLTDASYQVLIPLTDLPPLALALLLGNQDDAVGIYQPLVVAIEATGDSAENKTGNDVKCLISSFTGRRSNDGITLQIVDQFIELFDGRVLNLKRLFKAGVENDNQPAAPISNVNAASTNEAISSSLGDLCIVCRDQVVTRAFLPCRHACVCKTCFSLLPGSECPICRSRISSFFLIGDESNVPLTEEEVRADNTREINSMGLWQFIKSVWNAS